MYRVFHRKREAEVFWSRASTQPGLELRLFQEDIDMTGKKVFIVADPRTVYDKTMSQEEAHYYEFWTDKMPLHFAVDIDCRRDAWSGTDESLLRDVIQRVTDAARTKHGHDQRIEDIVVLENLADLQLQDNPNKLSFHIIFRGLCFDSYLGCKDFFQYLKREHTIQELFVDPHIYGLGCLRLFMSSKKGRRAMLVTRTVNIDGRTTRHLSGTEDGYDLWRHCMITNVGADVEPIKVAPAQPHLKVVPPGALGEAPTDKRAAKQPIAARKCAFDVEEILMSLPQSYCDSYETWIKVGIMLANHSGKTADNFDLWRKWSMQSGKYEDHTLREKWQSFIAQPAGKKITVGTLFHWAKTEGIKMSVKRPPLDVVLDTYVGKPIQVTMQGRGASEVTMIEQPKLDHSIYLQHRDKRLLAVQSEKSTGKTSNLFKAMFESDFGIKNDTSILVVSSRITFGHKMHGDLKQHGFDFYKDIREHSITSKRIICQIDSLSRLDAAGYDVLIVDECESVARYLTSSHFVRNPKAMLIESELEMLVQNSGRVIIMDADLSDRSLNFYSNIVGASPCDRHVIINTFKTFSEYTVTAMNFSAWVREMIGVLEEGKRLVVPMASNNKAKDLYTYVRGLFPDKRVLLIHKETNEEEKRTLLYNVNQEWVNYDVIIYTPSVCMGVSFDVPNHFDAIYAYGCQESLGAQEFCQMLHRVRSPASKNVRLALDEYQVFDPEEHSLTFEAVEQLINYKHYLDTYDLHNNIIPKRMVFEQNEKRICYPYQNEPIYDLYVRNCWEQVENRLNFSASLFGYIKAKGYAVVVGSHTAEDAGILKEFTDIKEDRVDREHDQEVSGILAAPDLSRDEYLEKSRLAEVSDNLSDADRHSLQRYNLRKCYEVEGEVSREFIEEYHDKQKMGWYRNLAAVLSSDQHTTQDKLEHMRKRARHDFEVNSAYVVLTRRNKYVYHRHAMDIITHLGLAVDSLPRTLPCDEDFCTRLSSLMAVIDPVKQEVGNLFDTRLDRRPLPMLTLAMQLNTINKLLKAQYGLKVTKEGDVVVLSYGELWDNLRPREPRILPTKLPSASRAAVVVDTDYLDSLVA